ncbi:hypothetical protein DSM104299_03909 [Baekduia alba]|uniref:DUF7144 family membrane protein n=1 Tax=Baekduia alba TaxID=2997333 RepID=UPI0023419DE9|nr:hypothetical protein [Baekduia alba]WCB95166.1 hypothetical protein DSM104299_03909 [Baekduia alba]
MSQSTMPAGDVGTGGEYGGARSGWVTFAGVMLSIVGALNIIYGIAAIDNANFYVDDARYAISSLSTWGWVLLLIGALQFGAAFSIFGGTSWGRWVGVIAAGLNAIAQLLFLPAYPLLALALFAVDIIVIHALIAHYGPGPAR